MKWFLLVVSISFANSAIAGFSDAVACVQQGNYQQAFRAFKVLAQQGNVTAQYNVAFMYAKGLGINQDYSQAFEWFFKAAYQGDVESQYHLAGMYEHGLGVKQDYHRAAMWYQQAAEHGMLAAQVSLAGLYGIGLGVNKNIARAYMWFSLAAKQGDNHAAEAESLLLASLSEQELKQVQQSALQVSQKYLKPTQIF